MSYNNQLPVVLQYFTNIVAIQTVGVLQLICHNFPLVRDKLPGGARICETGL